MFQPEEVDKLRVGRVGNEVHLGRRRFGRWDLEEGFLQLLAEGELGSGLSLGGCLAVIHADTLL